MRTGPLLFLLAKLLLGSSIAAQNTRPNRPDTLTWMDSTRHRPVPVAFYHTHGALTGKPVVLFSHGYNENRPGSYLHYSYMAEALANAGWCVVSVQHELPIDEPLPLTGVAQVVRRPSWDRGAANLHFVLDRLRTERPMLDLSRVTVMGHSQGGDISMLFAQEHPELVQQVISLDNRRMPLPRMEHPRVSSIRSSDQLADAGVLPTPEEAARYGIRLQRSAVAHDAMSDAGPPEARAELTDLVRGLLDEVVDHRGRPDTLTVLTYNIRYDNPADSADRWDLRKAALAKAVLAEHPSIIGLQEGLAHQLAFLDAQWPGHARFGVGRDDGIARGEFSPIYYDTARFVLAEGRTLWLSPTPDSVSRGWDAACVRIATWAVLRDRQRGDSIWVVNTHWDHMGVEARRNSAALLLERLHPVLVAGKDVLLMGDLNATVEEVSVRTLGQFLLSACPDNRSAEGTYNGFGNAEPPHLRIDHVLISPTRWQVVAYDVPHPAVNGRQVSDHSPVVVRLLR